MDELLAARRVGPHIAGIQRELFGCPRPLGRGVPKLPRGSIPRPRPRAYYRKFHAEKKKLISNLTRK